VEWLLFVLIILDVVLVIIQLSLETTKVCVVSTGEGTTGHHAESNTLDVPTAHAEPVAGTNITATYEFPDEYIHEAVR